MALAQLLSRLLLLRKVQSYGIDNAPPLQGCFQTETRNCRRTRLFQNAEAGLQCAFCAKVCEFLTRDFGPSI